MLGNSIQGTTKQAIRRLAHGAGAMRISGLAYDEIREVLKVLLESVIRDATAYCVRARRKTVTAVNVGYALKRHDLTLDRFGD
uniref:Histone H4 n=1 Tax=Angiostrongylus cantonensis TaxID=6313 RepID=A0A0K0DRL4_ANGCA